MNSYPKAYIDHCRSRMESQLVAYQGLAAVARKKAGNDDKALNAALRSFEPLFFNNLAFVLEASFVRSRLFRAFFAEIEARFSSEPRSKTRAWAAA